MSVKDQIERKLASALNPSKLEVIDESHHHAGHAGARPGGESHFRVKITADALTGVSRVESHRKIYGALGEELKSQVHALAIEIVSP